VWAAFFIAACSGGLFAGAAAASVKVEVPIPPRAAAGVIFYAPTAWNEQKPDSRLKLFQFEVPSPDPAFQNGQMEVLYFGPNKGGTVQSHVDRWKAEFTETDKGFPPVSDMRTVNGLRVTTVQIEGIYQSTMPGADRLPKKDWAVAGAIVEGPEGLLFFKMSGPVVTVRSARPVFDMMTSNIRREKPVPQP
jgi:hypothetical protein